MTGRSGRCAAPDPGTYFGGSGDDVIDAANGEREDVACGSGRDKVFADGGDRLSRCEVVLRLRRVR